jgi:hypothetical protein
MLVLVLIPLLITPVLFLAAYTPSSPAARVARTALVASQDTFVSRAEPAAVFGKGVRLLGQGSPAKRALLRFELKDLPPDARIVAARLRLHVADTSRSGTEVRLVTGPWNERATNWRNSPNPGRKIATLPPAKARAWIEVGVKRGVRHEPVVNFYLVNRSPDGVTFSSRETRATAPRLIVRWTRRDHSTTPTPDPDFQPRAPIAAAFFYPWFPSTWGSGATYPNTNFRPSLGYYSSTNNNVIDQQLRLARTAHIEAFISSWWGIGDGTDRAFRHILGRSERAASPYQELRWSLYYEMEGQGDPSSAQIAADLRYLADRYFERRGYLKVGGKPVVFVYADDADGAGMVQRWADAEAEVGVPVHIVLKVFEGYENVGNQPDSWHKYGPAVPYHQHGGHSAVVAPGFWRFREDALLHRDPQRFEADLRVMVKSGAFWHLVTTWNEWGEGTAVEPSREFGLAYIQAMCRTLPGSANCDGSATATPTPTRTPSSTPTPTPTNKPSGFATLVGAGDIAVCDSDGDEATARLLDGIPGTVFTAGDNAYEDGSTSDFQDCYAPSWGRHRGRTKPSPGNHDYHTSGAAGYFGYFGELAGPGQRGYYAYDLGAWRIYSLNSNCDDVEGGCEAAGEQVAWLRGDLAANPRACVAAYWHHPLFSSGNHGNNSEMADIWEALDEAGADVVLAGHDHHYERFAPMVASGERDDAGIRAFVVGTGGRGLYSLGSINPNSEVRNNTTHGVLKLTLRADRYDWEFVPVAGATFTDSGSGRCH